MSKPEEPIDVDLWSGIWLKRPLLAISCLPLLAMAQILWIAFVPLYLWKRWKSRNPKSQYGAVDGTR